MSRMNVKEEEDADDDDDDYIMDDARH